MHYLVFLTKQMPHRNFLLKHRLNKKDKVTFYRTYHTKNNVGALEISLNLVL